jgi:hypothetical protein
VLPDPEEVEAGLLGHPDLLEQIPHRLGGADRLAFRVLPGRAEAVGAKLELHQAVITILTRFLMSTEFLKGTPSAYGNQALQHAGG